MHCHLLEIRFILTQDERWAAFMANAYGRLSGKPGVCLSTLGPGATNLITGVADALLDFSPLVAITGQVGLKQLHKESHQYLDILSTLKPVTKWNARIEDPDTTPEIIRKAFKISTSEKPGPVHIELPEDVASLEAEGNPIPHDAVGYSEVSEDSLLKAISLIKASKMPLVLAGNGIIRGRATKEFRDFVHKTKIGVTTTFMGMGTLPADDECFISTVGLQSKDYISCGFDRADLILTIGYDPVEFAPHFWNRDVRKKIIHINFSPSETDAHYPAIELIGDIKTTLSLLSEMIDSAKDMSFYHTLKLYADHGLHFSTQGFPIKPLRIINDIRKVLGKDDILISDVGAHKLWIARFFPAYGEKTVIISNGLASMGFAIPSAISAKLLYPDKNVIAVAGDGGFLMSMCELNTAMRLGLRFVCIIFNDGGYGLIEWKEKLRYRKDFFVKFHNPDFVKLAESFGAKGYRITSEDELLPVLEESLKQSLPVIIDCPVDYSENLRLTEKLGKLICPL